MEDKKYLSNVGKTEVKKLINSLQVKKVWMQSSFLWKNKFSWNGTIVKEYPFKILFYYS